MSSGHPPSSMPPGNGRLEASRGALRDALGGVRNLEQLVRSIRVGPKGLTAVIPDVQASIANMRSSVHELLEALAEALPNQSAIDALRAFVEPRIAQLEATLAATRRRRMTAKSRLELESTVSRLSPELDTARELIELLAEAAWGAKVRIDVAELVRQTFNPSVDAPPHTVFVARLAPVEPGWELLVNPRVAMGLFSVGVASVASAHPEKPPFFGVSRNASGQVTVTLQPDGPGGSDQVVVARPPIEPTLICAEAAATLTRAELEWSADGSRFVITWPNQR